MKECSAIRPYGVNLIKAKRLKSDWVVPTPKHAFTCMFKHLAEHSHAFPAPFAFPTHSCPSRALPHPFPLIKPFSHSYTNKHHHTVHSHVIPSQIMHFQTPKHAVTCMITFIPCIPLPSSYFIFAEIHMLAHSPFVIHPLFQKITHSLLMPCALFPFPDLYKQFLVLQFTFAGSTHLLQQGHMLL